MSASSSDSEQIVQGGGYEIKSIVQHDTFENLVRRCLNKEIAFYPPSIEYNKKQHCKYAFLVDWENYNKFDRTWEPEDHFDDPTYLNMYKKTVNLEINPRKCETFEKEYTTRKRRALADCYKEVSRMMRRKSKKHNAELLKKAMEKESESVKSSTIEPKMKEKVPPKETPKREKVSTKKRQSENNKASTGESNKTFKVIQEKVASPSFKIVETPSPSIQSLESMKLHIRAPLPHRTFETHLNLRRNRRCASAENLNERLKEKSEIEMMNRMHFKIDDCCGEDEVQTIKKLITETDQVNIDRADAEEKQKTALISSNQNKARKFLEVVQTKLNENHWEGIDEVVATYTIDHFTDCKELLEQFPNAWRFLIIQSLIFTCKTYSSWQAQQLWVKRAKKTRRGNDRLFMESDEDVISDVPFYVEKCSAGHTKCNWLGIFLSLLPEYMRFEESSGYNFSSSKKASSEDSNSDGPFRDDMFLHCIKFGADCQKLKFLMYGLPLGDSTTEEYGYNVNYVHLVCCQGSSLRRIQQFMAVGFDIHPIATNVETGQLLKLSDYIRKFWRLCVKTKLENSQKIDSALMKYYEELPKMIRKISAEMKRLMKCEHDKNFTINSRLALSIDKSITYPHILRCNPTQNKKNRGRGEHQIQTCLFFEKGCCFSKGLREESEQNEEEIRCATFLKDCRKKVRERRGRFVLCVYRVDIMITSQDETSDEITLPHFEFVHSDKDMRIDEVSVVPINHTEGCPELRMQEIMKPGSGGQRIYAFDDMKVETEILKPGPAFIVIKGHFDIPINFMVQIVFVEGSN